MRERPRRNRHSTRRTAGSSAASAWKNPGSTTSSISRAVFRRTRSRSSASGNDSGARCACLPRWQRLQQREALHVADVNLTAGPRRPHHALDHAAQIIRAREILADGVHRHGVERSHLDPVQVRRVPLQGNEIARRACPHVFHGGRGKIGHDILLALGRERQRLVPRAPADFQQPPRFHRPDAGKRLLLEFAHLLLVILQLHAEQQRGRRRLGGPQRLRHLDALRVHPFPLRMPCADDAAFLVTLAGDDVRHQPPFAGRVLADQHDALAHARAAR